MAEDDEDGGDKDDEDEDGGDKDDEDEDGGDKDDEDEDGEADDFEDECDESELTMGEGDGDKESVACAGKDVMGEDFVGKAGLKSWKLFEGEMLTPA